MNEQYGLTVENLLNVLPDVLRQDEKMLALATGVAEILTARPARLSRICSISTSTLCQKIFSTSLRTTSA